MNLLLTITLVLAIGICSAQQEQNQQQTDSRPGLPSLVNTRAIERKLEKIFGKKGEAKMVQY